MAKTIACSVMLYVGFAFRRPLARPAGALWQVQDGPRFTRWAKAGVSAGVREKVLTIIDDPDSDYVMLWFAPAGSGQKRGSETRFWGAPEAD